MKLIKMFTLAISVVPICMASIGVSSASATSTQLCNSHTSLTCSGGNATSSVSLMLALGTVGKLLSSISVLCLKIAAELTPLGLGSPQTVHTAPTALEFAGCGTGSAHNNCLITVEERPLFTLLKTGLDEGVLEALFGLIRLECPNIGILCYYDFAGTSLSVGGWHYTAEEAPLTELGEKFFCPDASAFDALLQSLFGGYVLG